jgi:hypothetical protein
MLALKLVRLIEEHSEELSMGLTDKLRQSERTRDFWKVSPDGLCWQAPRFTTTWESGCCRRQKPTSQNGLEGSASAGPGNLAHRSSRLQAFPAEKREGSGVAVEPVYGAHLACLDRSHEKAVLLSAVVELSQRSAGICR